MMGKGCCRPSESDTYPAPIPQFRHRVSDWGGARLGEPIDVTPATPDAARMVGLRFAAYYESRIGGRFGLLG